MNNNVGLRIVSALVLVAAIAGIGFFAYQAGVANGSPVSIQAPAGDAPAASAPYYGYGSPFHRPFGFGFGCFGLLVPIFLFLFAMKAFRFMFWGSPWRHMGYRRGMWGSHREGGAPSMFDEWHKRAHNVPPGDGEESEDKKE